MNKPRLERICWECKTPVKITRQRAAQVGEFVHCPKCEQNFKAWLTQLKTQQN